MQPPMNKAALLAALLVLTFASNSLADALLFVVGSTPYDRQMERIKPVLTASKRVASDDPSLDIVNHWMAGLRSIPYGFTPTWKTPEETESGAPADCKAK